MVQSKMQTMYNVVKALNLCGHSFTLSLYLPPVAVSLIPSSSPVRLLDLRWHLVLFPSAVYSNAS